MSHWPEMTDGGDNDATVDRVTKLSRYLNPTGCGCLCHDVDGDTNVDGGCELCEEVHGAVRDNEGTR